jgi:hypothetical protein
MLKIIVTIISFIVTAKIVNGIIWFVLFKNMVELNMTTIVRAFAVWIIVIGILVSIYHSLGLI